MKKTLPRRKNRPAASKGFPVATVAFYGPDNMLATKVAVGILDAPDQLAAMQTWTTEDHDVRNDIVVSRQIIAFIKEHKAKKTAVTDRIIGCPHEEGVDYPEGTTCPRCPYWKDKDRWTGMTVQHERGE